MGWCPWLWLASRMAASPETDKPVVIVGAGVAGLTAAAVRRGGAHERSANGGEQERTKRIAQSIVVGQWCSNEQLYSVVGSV